MKIAPIALAQIATVSATLLLGSGGLVRADEYTRHGATYRSHYGEPRAIVVRRGSIYQTRYNDPREDFAYAPEWGGYTGDSSYQCQLPPSSIDYVPCDHGS